MLAWTPSSTNCSQAMSDHTLAFVIDAPMQSWGASSRFQQRDTASWPTKSALVGIMAAAMGIDKHAEHEAELIAPLAALRCTVLLWPKEAPVTRLLDFHTVGGGFDKSIPMEKLSMPSKAGDGSAFGTVITRRTYLSDARFIALFEGDHAVLESCAAALRDPVWGVWFGRKCCPPSRPLGPVVADSRQAALALLADLHGEDAGELSGLGGLTECTGPGSHFLNDQPVAFGRHHAPEPQPYPSRAVRRFGPGEE